MIVQIPSDEPLTLCEVQVFAIGKGVSNYELCVHFIIRKDHVTFSFNKMPGCTIVLYLLPLYIKCSHVLACVCIMHGCMYRDKR